MSESEVAITLIPDGACEAHRIDESVTIISDSQFRSVDRLYTGTFSSIFRSGLLDSRTPGHVRSVIIKGIRPIGEQDPSLFVLNELNIWRLLNGHLHIALFLGITNLHRFDTGCTRPLAVSHYYERGTPREFIRNTEPRLDCEARLTLLIGILRGLEHIHNQKVVHGDLKGDNVVIGTLGDKLMAKITDFGSSRLACLDCVSGNLSDPEGTVLWDSPEVGMEETGRTIWSDIWAAGCVALEVQLDTFPYTPRFEEPGNSHILIAMNRQRNGLPPADIADFNFEAMRTSEAVWIIIQDCWNRVPSQRPGARQLAARLEGIL
ncbi:hypothetical protein RSOLAG22IIIB_07548 [Rhizoctonia solani]|uniref:Protein kinase domain-containing protein n=1 Tax=Rhizoctonia solani TaxID=456999 RepID=A0A0K6FNA2_9AGAM|nr:hypothetical protein RSOLAG22IIIB_07548 [Rhizoctonia solani]